MTLRCGFLVLAPNQITAADGLIRRWTELLWTGNKKLHRLEGNKVRYVYFAILISHVILAAAILPMAIFTLSRGLRGRYVEHKRIAKKTFPAWMYVSVTGVIVYLMLYQM